MSSVSNLREYLSKTCVLRKCFWWLLVIFNRLCASYLYFWFRTTSAPIHAAQGVGWLSRFTQPPSWQHQISHLNDKLIIWHNVFIEIKNEICFLVYRFWILYFFGSYFKTKCPRNCKKKWPKWLTLSSHWTLSTPFMQVRRWIGFGQLNLEVPEGFMTL